MASRDAIVLDGSAKAVSCSGAQLVVGVVVYARACPALAEALESAAANGWTPQSVGPCP